MKHIRSSDTGYHRTTSQDPRYSSPLSGRARLNGSHNARWRAGY